MLLWQKKLQWQAEVSKELQPWMKAGIRHQRELVTEGFSRLIQSRWLWNITKLLSYKALGFRQRASTPCNSACWYLNETFPEGAWSPFTVQHAGREKKVLPTRTCLHTTHTAHLTEVNDPAGCLENYLGQRKMFQAMVCRCILQPRPQALLKKLFNHGLISWIADGLTHVMLV